MGWIQKLEGARGTRYRAFYRSSDRKIYSATIDPATKKPFIRKIDAEAWIKGNEVDIGRGTWANPEAGRKSLQTVYDELHASRSYAPATLALHREAWKQVPGRLKQARIGDISPADITTFLGRIDKPAMREKIRLLLSTVFTHSALTTNPAARKRKSPTRQERLEQRGAAKRRKNYLNEEELSRLLAVLPEEYRGLVELMSRMGLRPGEAYALQVRKFDPIRRRLLIDTSTTGFTKTGEPRELVLPAVVAVMLVEHIAWFSDPANPDALIFPADQGGMVNANNFRSRAFNPACAAAGITKKLTPNSCRHTAASFAIAHGATVYAVQQMLGHAKPSITLDVYGELWEESQERLAETLDAAIRSSKLAGQAPAEIMELPR